MARKREKIMVLIGVIVIALMATSAAFSAETKPIVFGLVWPFQGTGAVFGEEAKLAAEMAVEEINAAGGLLGRSIACIVRDAQADPEIMLREAKNLVYDSDVLWINAGVGSGLVAPTINFASEQGKKENFLVWVNAAANWVNGEKFNRYTFRVSQNATACTRSLAPGIYRRWSANKVLCVGADYSYGREDIKSFRAEYLKVNPKAEFTDDVLVPLNSTDFTPYLSKIMASDASLVYNSLWGADYGAFMKQAYAYGYYDKKHEAGSALGTFEAIGQLRKGDPYPKGVLSGEYAPAYEVYGKLGKGLYERFYKKYGRYAGHGAFNTYSEIYLMANAIKEAKTTDIDKIIDNLEDKWVEHACGRFKMRGYDHQLLIPFWTGIIEFTGGVPFPRTEGLWAPADPESLYHTIAEIKEIRKKAGNPYVDYLGH